MKRTLSELRTSVRQRINYENTNFVTDTELTSIINTSLARLVDLLADSDIQVTSAGITSSGTATLTLSQDIYQLKRVDWNRSSSIVDTLRSYPFQEGNKWKSGYPVDNTGCQTYEYHRVFGGINLIPTPPAGQTFTIWYIPVLTLSNSTDTVDLLNYWEDYLITDASIRCLSKEEADTTQLERERDRLELIIKRNVRNLDRGNPVYVSSIWSRS